RQHRAGTSDVIAHAWACRLASAESRPGLEPSFFGAFRAAEARFGFRAAVFRFVRQHFLAGIAVNPNALCITGYIRGGRRGQQVSEARDQELSESPPKAGNGPVRGS